MNQRIAITGAGGRLGAALARHFSSKGEVIAWSRAEADLADIPALRERLAATEFDLLINAAALTQVDYCESHREEAMAINADAVAVLGEICAEKGARLLHVSTDYVFSGDQRTPYRETDTARPISVYGESKRVGEQAALAASDENLVVRVSWVYGPDRPAFPDMILGWARERDRVEAIADKISTPASTAELVLGIEALIAADAQGIVHLCDAGACTWQEYGQAVLDSAVEAGMKLRTTTVDPIPLAAMTQFEAKRPVYSVMATDFFTEWTGRRPRPWQDPLREFVRKLVG